MKRTERTAPFGSFDLPLIRHIRTAPALTMKRHRLHLIGQHARLVSLGFNETEELRQVVDELGSIVQEDDRRFSSIDHMLDPFHRMLDKTFILQLPVPAIDVPVPNTEPRAFPPSGKERSRREDV